MKIEYIENKNLQTEIKTFVDSPQQHRCFFRSPRKDKSSGNKIDYLLFSMK